MAEIVNQLPELEKMCELLFTAQVRSSWMWR